MLCSCGRLQTIPGICKIYAVAILGIGNISLFDAVALAPFLSGIRFSSMQLQLSNTCFKAVLGVK